MPLRIDTKHMSQPEGGWSFAIPDGPILSSDKVGAPGLSILVSQIIGYRNANGQPSGDPENDVAITYAAKHPWLILSTDPVDETVDDAETWIHRIWRSFPIPMVETRVRDERFEQCQQCVHFEPLDTIDMSNEAKRRLILMNPNKIRTEHGWCLLRGWIPSIAVQFHSPAQFSDEKRAAEECWLNDTDKKP